MKFNPKKYISPKYLFLALSVICIILLGLSLFSDSLVLKLKETFGWKPRWDIAAAVGKTVEWTKEWQAGGDVRACMERQIRDYMRIE